MNAKTFLESFPDEDDTTLQAVLEKGGSNVASFDDFFAFSVQNGYRALHGKMTKVSQQALRQTIGRGTSYETFFKSKAKEGLIIGGHLVKAFPKKRFQRVKDAQV